MEDEKVKKWGRVMLQVHMIIGGDVQGVGYRKWALNIARTLGVVGWVKNREDRTVEIVAVASREILDQFIELCHTGPELAVVKDIQMLPITEERQYDTFTVIY